MALEAGTRLGHYEVVSSLGAGGMGEVYRAKDTKLGREVAIKVLPEGFSDEPERIARFEREAKVLASLNHPSIATLYGFETQDAIPFLVMELVEGDTLADRIERGPISIAEALPLFLQIAEGLEAAHAAGIIHRDLKPANIKLGGAGSPSTTSLSSLAKILDFGLAKAMAPETVFTADSGLSQSPTLTLAATQRGEILGTAAYMSPEQAQGKPVDKRADIWAFGVCLWESLVGRRVFEGDNASMTMARVLDREPEWELLPDLPWRVREVLGRCLQKNPSERLHDIADARLELRSALVEPDETRSGGAGADPAAKKLGPLPWLVAVAASAAVAGLAAWTLKPEPPADVLRAVMSVAPSLPTQLSVTMSDLAVTPDGSRIIYGTQVENTRGLYLRPVDQLEGSILVSEGPSFNPFVSPNGEWVGYGDFGERAMKKISVLGGPAVTVVELPPPGVLRGASWGDDDHIVYAGVNLSGLWRVHAAGGEPEALTTPDSEKGETNHFHPHVLPGAEAVLFTIDAGNGDFKIAVLELESGEIRTLIPGGSSPRYATSGHLVYGVEGTLRAVAFDLDQLEVVGNPVPVLEGVVTKGSGAVDFDLSSDGRLVYVAGDSVGGFASRMPVWVDRQGQETPIDGLRPQAFTHARLSPDGRKAALAIVGDETDIWIWDFEVGNLSRLTFSPATDVYPVWTPDGQRVAFGSDRDGSFGIYLRAASGAGTIERLTEGTTFHAPNSFSPDGRQLVYRNDGSESEDLHHVSLDGGGEGEPLVGSPYREGHAAVSPNGRWLAYRSFESGQTQVYVRPFPNVDEGRWQISGASGGYSPIWSQDGTELFFRSGPEVWVVPVEIEGDFRFGTAERLFTGPYFFQSPGNHWDVSPDGQRFLMLRAGTVAQSGIQPDVVMVENWFEELKRLVPTG